MSAKRPLSVVIIDDSPSVRAVLRRFLSRSPEIRVLGEAADGLAALEVIERLRPDVLLLDLAMPKLDGFGVLARLARTTPVPAVILTSRANRAEVRAAFEALRAGAVELLPKPEDPDSWRQLSEMLPTVLQSAAAVERSRAPARPDPVPALPAARPPFESARGGEPLVWLVLGASTGGPAALRDLLAALPAPPPLRVLVVQHIARGFEGGLADWLAGSLGLDVRVAVDGERPRAGTVRIAPAGAHLKLAADGRLRLDAESPPRRGHKPSADELFLSVAAVAGPATAAALLTGMGSDGAEGLAALRQAGAWCFAQDEPSSAVFGMPRAAIELGAAAAVLPPRRIGEELARRLRESA